MVSSKAKEADDEAGDLIFSPYSRSHSLELRTSGMNLEANDAYAHKLAIASTWSPR